MLRRSLLYLPTQMSRWTEHIKNNCTLGVEEMKHHLRTLCVITCTLLLVMVVTKLGDAQAPITSPTPTPSLEERLSELENQVNALQKKTAKPAKDIWDITSSLSGLISGVVIAAVGILLTHQFNKRQQQSLETQHRRELAVQQVQTALEFVPLLQSGDEKDKETALLGIAALGNPELATKLAALYRTKGATSALSKMAASPDRAIAAPAKKVLNRFEKEALRKLRLICKEYPDPDEEFEDYLFTSGTYGQNVTSAELETMIKYGWVQQKASGERIRITQAGRKAAGATKTAQV
jgi:hypothetical protein